MSANQALQVIDDTLIRLRRLWTGKAAAAGPADRDRDVELSTVLVVDAIDRIRADVPAGSHVDVTVRAVATRLDVASSTASRLVDRAVQAQMVARHSSESDSRRSALMLTDRGEQLLEEATAFRLGYLADVLDGWSARDVDTFARLLDRFAADVRGRAPLEDRGARAGR